MSTSDDCKITDYNESKDYVKVTFSPDLRLFQMKSLDDDIVSLLTKRVYDIAGCCGVKVHLNGRKLPVNDFKSYVDLYFPPKEASTLESGWVVVSHAVTISYSVIIQFWFLFCFGFYHFKRFLCFINFVSLI